MAITTRETTATGVTNKGSPLTNAEVDTNFVELKQDKLENVVEDTTPQLGGDLDLNSSNVTGTGNINITGNIALSGTVDGRDIATDGTKLDGVEASADVTDAANVTAAGALMDSEVTNLAQVKAFDSADYATAAQGTKADSALQNVVADATPQLGGDLDVNGSAIVSASNADIAITPDGSGKVVLDGINFPTSDGSNGHVLQTNGSGQLSFAAPSSGDVVDDTSPQLGGDLDVNGNAIVSSSNGNIAVTPNGSGKVVLDSNVDVQSGEIAIKNSGSLSNVKFYCEVSNAHYTQLQSSPHSAYSGNVTLTLPPATDMLVGRATTDTLTNKTLTSPTINGGTHTSFASTGIDDNADTLAMTISSSEDISIGSASNHAGARVVINDNPPTAFGSPMLQIGQETFNAGGYYSIGFGYTAGSYTEPPAEIAAVATSSTGGTTADIVFGTRSVTTNTAVTERMRLSASGLLGLGENAPATPLHIKTANKLGSTFTGSTRGEGVTVEQSIYTSGNYISLIEGVLQDGGEPTARIGVLYSGSGSTLTFGTSSNYASGITNAALTIDPSGNVAVTGTFQINSIPAPVGGWFNALCHESGVVKADTAVQIHGSGYLKANYLNMQHSIATRSSDTVFFSSDDTYVRKNDATGFIASLNSTQRSMATQKWAVASNYGHGIYGVYSGSRYQHVWSMGTSYNMSADGTGVGNIYGLTWTHTNVGTGTHEAVSGLSHQLQVRANGNLWAAMGYGLWTAGNVTAYSDIAVKENIKKIDNALEKVCQINGYTYDRIDIKKHNEEAEENNPVRQAGVIAQEIEKVLPEVVQGEEGSKSVAYGNIVGLLIEAIKEQQEQIEKLKERA